MSDVRYSATAKVVLTVEVPVKNNWGGNCSVEQIHKQATDEAVGYIANLQSGLRLVGKPEVTSVFVKRDT